MEWKQPTAVEGGISIPQRWVFLRYYEAFNLLFRIENALRIFVYIVLKNKFRDKWAETQVIGDDEHGTIGALAKKRMSQAQTFGYLGHEITCPIMQLNSGELTRLITSEAQWGLFKEYFSGSKDIIKSKLEEIGSIRNSLAHFRPIRADDVDVIKQNSKHVLLDIEPFLNQVLLQNDVIPTNTEDEWYRNLRNLRTLGTDQCTFTFQQSTDEKWVCISLKYACPIIKKMLLWHKHVRYQVLTIRSSRILTKWLEVAKDVCYLSERLIHPRMLEEQNAEFGKIVSIVLSRSMLSSNHQELKAALEGVLSTIATETALIQQDNLARGELVYSVSVNASLQESEERKYWQWNYQSLYTEVAADPSPEYWGNLNFNGWEDFVAATDKYPWMPEPVSEEESPF